MRLPVFKDVYLMKVSKHVLCMRLPRVHLIIVSNYHMTTKDPNPKTLKSPELSYATYR